MKCEKCGAEMNYFVKGQSQVYECPRCGWGVCTSYYSPEELDTTEYELKVLPQDAEINKVKALSKVTALNYLECRKILQNGDYIIKGQSALRFSSDTMTFHEKAKLIKEAGIAFVITPIYPYEV